MNVAAGTDIILKCTPPEARPDPVITWQKDGRRLNTELRPRMSILDDGSLFIASATSEDAGSYVCVGENPAKLRKSKAAVVTVS